MQRASGLLLDHHVARRDLLVADLKKHGERVLVTRTQFNTSTLKSHYTILQYTRKFLTHLEIHWHIDFDSQNLRKKCVGLSPT